MVAPVILGGDVRGLPDDAVLAVSVNGRIESTTKLFRERERLEYAAVVRPSSLRPGANRLAVLAVGADDLQTIATTG